MNNNNTNNQHTTEYGARKFFYNNAIFVVQVGFGLFTIGFSSAMLIIGRPAEVYLPLITLVLGYFLPTPVNHKLEAPSGIPQIREMLLRGNLNNV